MAGSGGAASLSRVRARSTGRLELFASLIESNPAPEMDTGIREGALDINPAPTGPVFNRSFLAKKGNFCVEKLGVFKCGLLPALG